MFTGIVEETGTVEKIVPGERSIKLTLRAKVCVQGLRAGDSLAVNGCCLTVLKVVPRGRHKLIQFDLLQETWNRTNLRYSRTGSLVNLERSVPANGRFGGHFVSGHIDGLGKISRWERAGQDYVLEIATSPGLMRYVVFKGSIAVDGISLTVAKVARRGFQIWIIPHTYDVTAMRERKKGDPVNMETDLIGKYVEKFVTSISGG